MLTHHSSQDYPVAASAAAKEARGKFEAEIERGKTRALAVIEQVNSQMPVDHVYPLHKLEFGAVSANGKKPSVSVRFPNGEENPLHRHAVQQAASKVSIPLTYIDNLLEKQDDWRHQLVAHNLNELARNAERKTRILTRSVKGEVRGFLSDSYRRMDSRPILESFIGAMQKFGAVPVDGFALDTKIAIKAVLPYVFEPVPYEVMIFGAYFGNSDFGDGAVDVRTFIERLWCTNRAIGSEELRKIHLGARLSEDLQLSKRTYELDTQTMASAVSDIMIGTLAPTRVEQSLALIRKANEEKVAASDVTAFLKKNLRKDEAENVLESYISPDIENLPAGASRWRLSNAISWIANSKIEDEGRKLEVMKIAGQVLDGGTLKIAA